MPIIGESINQPEGFQYAMVLYTNMGHYTTGMFPNIRDMTALCSLMELGKCVCFS